MRMATTGFALQNRRARRVVAVFCLALFVVLQAFASSGPLHKAIHPDADSSDHHCAITMLAQGQVDTPVVWLGLAAFAAALIFCLPPLNSEAFSSVDYRLSPSRAPPLV